MTIHLYVFIFSHKVNGIVEIPVPLAEHYNFVLFVGQETDPIRPIIKKNLMKGLRCYQVAP